MSTNITSPPPPQEAEPLILEPKTPLSEFNAWHVAGLLTSVPAGVAAITLLTLAAFGVGGIGVLIGGLGALGLLAFGICSLIYGNVLADKSPAVSSPAPPPQSPPTRRRPPPRRHDDLLALRRSPAVDNVRVAAEDQQNRHKI